MGCTNVRPTKETEFGYMQKETLYYKIRDKNEPGSKQYEPKIIKEDLNRMIHESLSSNSSKDEDSLDNHIADKDYEQENKPGLTTNILYMHKPSRPSKLKEIQLSVSKYDNSDKKNEKENTFSTIQ